MSIQFRKTKKSLLVLIIILLLSGCAREPAPLSEKEAEGVLAEKAFTEIEAARDILERIADDIYNAWHWSIQGDGKKTCTLAALAKKLGRTDNELKRGFALVCNEDKWEEMSAADRQKQINQAEANFKRLISSGYSKFSACVSATRGVYLENGSFSEATQHLEEAAEKLQMLYEQYPDSASYPKLKEYYAQESSLAEYCRKPTGSMEQAETTINDYRNIARTLSAELDLMLSK